MNEPNEAKSPESLVLPSRAKKYLELWRQVIPQVEPKPYFWLSFYNKIRNGDDTDLTAKEKLILDILLTASPINRTNLQQFVEGFETIKIKDTLISSVTALLHKMQDAKFAKAYAEIKDNETDAWILQDRVTRFELSEGLYEKLERFDFSSADKVVADNADAINEQMYLKTKASYFARYYESKFLLNSLPFLLDKNQSEAMLSEAKYTLAQGRAATGKTQLILAKSIYLNEQLHVKPEEVLLCAFDAALLSNLEYLGTKAITLKENGKQVYKKYPATLCSEAFSQALTVKDKLLPEISKEPFIEALLEGLWVENAEFREQLYEFLKLTDSSVDKKTLKNLDGYYNYNKNLRFSSLRGEKLSSLGEKWIADYLFEHGIEYRAEPEYNLQAIKTEDEKLIKFIKANDILDADFYLPDNKAILEYWAIDINEKEISQKMDFDKMFGLPWLTYKSMMQEKQIFWTQMRSVILNPEDLEVKELAEVSALLELSFADLKLGKVEFEKQLAERLASIGIKEKSVDKQKLYAEVWEINKSYLTMLFKSFIDRYQHNVTDDEAFKNKIEEYKDNARIFSFLNLAMQVLITYGQQLELSLKKRLKPLQSLPAYTIDDNQLLQKFISISSDKKLNELVKEMKWILIDAYQDFSPLWQKLIEKIIEVSPEVKLFAVGDGWQACKQDAGAGSNLIDSFVANFSEAVTISLITNYRSKRKLVVASNHFMQNNKFRGGTAQVSNTSNEPAVFIANILAAPGTKRLSKYINKVFEIIKESPTDAYLLVHPRYINGEFNLAEFYNHLLEKLVRHKVFKSADEVRQYVFTDYPENLAGVEINNVILLEVVQDVYPAVYLDNELFGIFSESIIQADEKQKKHFYLAITRAKERLWILTESGKESEYIESFV